ncbi:putative integral membrane protein [Theileria parva strain Muguga]|uniref:putative integral membrane protein n=1 Tax=Theileria parva strain Muguga TaxID=333668 RepID=UPI001C61E60B|nr:putative integral membrane protein [Theileria parva strain Muguga]EAN32551.2 putative integral membrane protein [Theileria parva strain Muguga]
MVFKFSCKFLIILIFTNKSKCFDYTDDESKLEESVLNGYLSECRLSAQDSTFPCLRQKLINHNVEYSGEYSCNLYTTYYLWLISLTNLSPNTVIYNEVPLEAYQSHLYRNNYIKEPKFAPLYYKIKFNDFYTHLRKYIHEDVNGTHSNLYTRLNKIFNTPTIVLEAKSSYTSVYDESIDLKLIGDNINYVDSYTKSFLLFVDYYLFMPLKRSAYRIKFLNSCPNLYKLRLFLHSKSYFRGFKRHKKLILDKPRLIKYVYLVKYFNIYNRDTNDMIQSSDSEMTPFIPLPVHSNGDRMGDLPLFATSVDQRFYILIENIIRKLPEVNRKIVHIFELLEKFVEKLYKVSDLRTIPTLDSFYILEVTPKSTGITLYNMFTPKERKLILDYKDSILVSSHVSKLDFDHFILQIVKKFIITTPIVVIFTIVIFKYINTFGK